MPSAAFAHITAGSGYLSGLTHPVLGPDHLLAMVSVGVLSALIGGRAIWTVPATFVTVMAIGGSVAMFGLGMPFVEKGIALSVVALGLAIAIDRKQHAFAAMCFVGLFGFFHGHAHGSEMPVVARPILYALGFVTGTATLHIAGVALGLIAEKLGDRGLLVLRHAGSCVAGIGIAVLLGI
jgi:urease accessory protein